MVQLPRLSCWRCFKPELVSTRKTRRQNVKYHFPPNVDVDTDACHMSAALSSSFRRNGDPHSRSFRFPDDFVRVVTAIHQQALRINPFDQLACLCAILSGTLCNKDSVPDVSPRIHEKRKGLRVCHGKQRRASKRGKGKPTQTIAEGPASQGDDGDFLAPGSTGDLEQEGHLFVLE
ncbi:MAG: hypothetical protein LBQ62_10990, partial [Candidatus Accumulibacter sp.]|nr:hypothetical protein [Accumulibacter sp.]